MLILVPLLFLIQKTFQIRNMTIFGNSTLGYYYLEAFVGIPPQKKSLIMDTGSHMTIFPCSGCYKCRNHINKIFNTTDSATFERVDPKRSYFDWKCSHANTSKHGICSFSQGYTEGSEYSGYYAVDNFIFENELEKKDLKYNHVFGCALKESGEFYSQEADGIIGFGVTRKGGNPPTILDIEKSENRIKNLIFSVCIAKNGGELSFGDWNKNLHLPKAKKKWIDTSDMNWSEQYKVPLTNIKIGDENVNYNFEKMNEDGGKAFFDTGTTFVYFDASLFKKFKHGINNHCQKHKKTCAQKETYRECYFWNKRLYPTKNDMMKTFPTITFDFNGTELEWYPQDYFVVPLDGTEHLCIGVKSLKNAILGAVLMRNYDIYFDRTKKRIGFSRSNCGQLKDYIDIFGYKDEDTDVAPKIKIKNKKSIQKAINKKRKSKSKKVSDKKQRKIKKHKKKSKQKLKKNLKKKLKKKIVEDKNENFIIDEKQRKKQRMMINIFVAMFILVLLLILIIIRIYRNYKKKRDDIQKTVKGNKEKLDKTE